MELEILFTAVEMYKFQVFLAAVSELGIRFVWNCRSSARLCHLFCGYQIVRKGEGGSTFCRSWTRRLFEIGENFALFCCCVDNLNSGRLWARRGCFLERREYWLNGEQIHTLLIQLIIFSSPPLCTFVRFHSWLPS